MIDTHAHLVHPKFNGDREEVIQRAFSSGVEKIIEIGNDFQSSKDAVELAEKYANIFATVGVHPHDVGELSEEKLNEMLKQVQHDKEKNNKVVAIGEIGLDYFKSTTPKNLQIKWFEAQLNLAKELDLPVVIHCRDAHEDVKNILKKKKINKGVIHCFSGNLDDAKFYIDLGLYISFTGVITYTDEYDEVIKNISLEKILIETDCPFLAPVPYRGKRNEPSFVKYVAQKISNVRKISIEEVSRITTANAEKLFAL